MPTCSALIRSAISRALKPDPNRLVSDWADDERYLTTEGSHVAGRWVTERVPYQRGIMDALSPSHPAIRVVVKKGSRSGVSECGNNAIGCWIDDSPGPILASYPNEAMATRVSKIKIGPMIDACASLRAKVASPRSRDSSNTILYKEFHNGQLLMIGVNSGAQLRETTARYLIMDDIDGFKMEIKGEGRTTELLERRTATFRLKRKIFMNSSPTEKGGSAIDIEYERGDQRRYFIPCFQCKHPDYLTWNGRDWQREEADLHHSIGWDGDDPKTVHMVCSKCRGRTPEMMKGWMLGAGEWRPTAEPADPETVSFHISSLYSPFESWVNHVEAFLEAKRDPTKLRTFVNHILGESYEDRSEGTPAADSLMKRKRFPAGVVPNGVGVLTGYVDVHQDRLEYQVEGWGVGEENWVIQWQSFLGDTVQEKVWLELDAAIREPFVHESGQHVRVSCVGVDAQYRSDEVYRFCKPRWPLVRAMKGMGESPRERRERTEAKTIVGRPSNKGNRYRCNLFPVETDAAKDRIMARLRILAPGPGYRHFNDGLDPEWFEQMASEKKMRLTHGFIVYWAWRKVRERNEAWDLSVGNLATLYSMGEPTMKGLGTEAAKLMVKVDPAVAAAPPAPKPPPMMMRRPRGWVNRYKGY